MGALAVYEAYVKWLLAVGESERVELVLEEALEAIEADVEKVGILLS